MNKLTKPDKQSTSNELIIYQLGEVKNLLGNMDVKFDSYKQDTDNRIKTLELAAAAQKVLNESQPAQKIDIQKIILACLALISSVVATALGLNRNSQ